MEEIFLSNQESWVSFPLSYPPLGPGQGVQSWKYLALTQSSHLTPKPRRNLCDLGLGKAFLGRTAKA